MYYSDIARLRDILNELRTKCPWDKKQTIHSLRQQTVEEVYELTDAIDREDWQQICEELGDVLLHVLFYSRIAHEQGQFSFEEVVRTISDKLIHRHPHIYGSVSVENEEEVKRNWEQLKLKEGKTSVLAGVPDAMPAMMKALRIQEKVKQVGFEWEDIRDVKKKVEEEFLELEEAITGQELTAVEDEMGDVFFALINYARYAGVDPEKALEKTNKKFISRFRYMESVATSKGENLQKMSLPEMDALWNEAKQHIKGL